MAQLKKPTMGEPSRAIGMHNPRYDVVIGGDLEALTSPREVFKFYEELGKIIEQRGKTVYLPHRKLFKQKREFHIAKQLGPEIANSELVLVDLRNYEQRSGKRNVINQNIYTILQLAAHSRKPIIAFYETKHAHIMGETLLPPLKAIHNAHQYQVVYATPEQGIRGISRAIDIFEDAKQLVRIPSHTAA